MAEALTLAEVQVLVTTQLGSLRKELDEINNRVKKTEQETKKATNAIGTGLNGASRKAADSVQRLTRRVTALAGTYLGLNAAISTAQRALESTRALTQLSAATGIGIDKLSELKVVAEASGVEFRTLMSAVESFGTRMRDAVIDPSNRTAEAMRAMGISILDASGEVRSFTDLLPELADRFASYQDGVNKSILANATFGERIGTELLPLLNQGSSRLRELAQRARELGFIVRTETVAETEDFRIASWALSNQLDALARTVIREVGPAFSEFLDWLNRTIPKVVEFGREVNRVAEQANRNVELKQAKEAWEDSLVPVRKWRAELNQITAALQKAKEEFGETSPEVEHLKERYVEIEAALHRATAAQREFARSLLLLENKDWELTVTPAKTPKTIPPLLPGDSGDTGGVSAGVNEAMLRASDEAQALIDRLMGQRGMLDELNFSWEAYAQSVTRAQELIRFSSESNYEAQRELTRLKIDLMKQEEQAAWDLANAATQALASLFPKQKAFAIANAVVNTAEGITKALSAYPPPFNFGMAAAVGAAGAAQIAAIARANPGGAASPPRPSTSGATSRTTPTTSTPPPLPKAVEVVIPPGDIWTSERVSELIKRINDEVSNGSILISTKTRPM